MLNDTANIEDRDRIQNKGSKGLATTTHLYTAKNVILSTSKKPDY